MPKRSYPFEGSCPQQLKTHVGQKELSEGVMEQHYKKEIFERTKRLLFNGAKTALGNGEHNGTSQPYPTSTALLAGQTFIGQDGKLHRNTRATKALCPGTSKACSFCVRSVGDKDTCSQCERSVCRSCCVSCACCSTSICTFCKVADSDVSELAFCASCSVLELLSTRT